ncbi:hypothetical protein K9O30_12295 [Clostridium bowmanii]|uniref:Ada metal-binding domain-containing protein n=1 Tax=Clostridium bowmanii TaxID=132925 RepID=UPI001C0C734B|nr:Ada metal-binding domain-containing protein [Clostridium bowmanii]MBU3190450.1 hypothetical protein [Clostridium bowmanii]MCA1074488.1 hypothetical protein [Clostridium bowmanii]
MCNKDSEYKRLFYCVVKAIGIYCIPSCSAKKSNKENVEFYDITIKAEDCKVCLPILCEKPTPLGVGWIALHVSTIIIFI